MHDRLDRHVALKCGFARAFGALVTDLHTSESILQVLHLADGALMLVPTRALVITSATQAAWEVRLTELQQRDPSACIQRLRWRQSVRGGRTWVKPAILDRDLRAARIRAGPAFAA